MAINYIELEYKINKWEDTIKKGGDVNKTLTQTYDLYKDIEKVVEEMGNVTDDTLKKIKGWEEKIYSYN